MSWGIFISLILAYWLPGIFVIGIIFGDKITVIGGMILGILWPIVFISWVLLAIITWIYCFGAVFHDILFNR